MKVEFLNFNLLRVFMRSSIDISNRGNLGVLLKQIGLYLKRKYQYIFSGLYNVEIYQYADYYVFEIEQDDDILDDSIDFNVSFHPNSFMLFEFKDEEYVSGEKYYFDENFYVDFKKVSSLLDCLEFGRVIYKEEVEEIMKKAILVF